MTKSILVIIILFSFTAQSQDSLHLFYINKIHLEQADSANLTSCTKKEYNGVSLEINLLSKNGNSETIYATGNNYTWFNDSVIFSYTVPLALYKKADSVITRPTFHIACTGLKGNRGVENVDAEGKETAVKNIALKFVSDPPGASVYLIPKMVWERTPAISQKRNEAMLSRYAIYNGVTPVESSAQEYVYIALFKLNNRFVPVECSPTHLKSDDSVYANFPH